MTSRWRHARSLSLSLRGTVKEGIAQALMTAQPCANEVTQLQLEWIPEWDEAEDLTGLVLLTWLAAHAEGLRSLSLSFSQLPAMPALPHLQHLVVEHAMPDFAAVIRVLPLLTSLQTLCLAYNGSCNDAEQADVDLSSLIHLRSVSLMGLMPSTLALPPTTELHVTTRQDWNSHPVWLSVLPMLRTITMAGIERLNKLPQILSLPSSLTTVLLSAGQVGYVNHPLRLGKLPDNVKYISITCRKAWYDLRGGTWEHLSIMAEETLEGACPLKTLLKCPDFYLEYSLDHQNEGCTFCAEHPSIWAQWLPHARACIWKGQGQSQHSAFHQRACTCGACMKCLAKSGGISGLA